MFKWYHIVVIMESHGKFHDIRGNSDILFEIDSIDFMGYCTAEC